MEELHKIETPIEETYFIAYNSDETIKAYGYVEPDQCMATMCARLETYIDINEIKDKQIRDSINQNRLENGED